MSGIESLPARFPIFPLSGVLLLPGGNLPLNIFEPRYLRMVEEAMRTDRVIGMIQPRDAEAVAREENPPVYGTGCAGRISNCSETNDGRLLITLTGVIRFDVAEELAVMTPYRQVRADFRRWQHDFRPDAPDEALRPELIEVLRDFFALHAIEADWRTIEAAPLAGLITSLAMICPFEPNEKQALLEARDPTAQAELLTALMRMAVLQDSREAAAIRH